MKFYYTRRVTLHPQQNISKRLTSLSRRYQLVPMNFVDENSRFNWIFILIKNHTFDLKKSGVNCLKLVNSIFVNCKPPQWDNISLSHYNVGNKHESCYTLYPTLSHIQTMQVHLSMSTKRKRRALYTFDNPMGCKCAQLL